MSLNCNEINKVLDELDIEASFIQQIVQPGYDSMALYCYKNGVSKTVLICLAAGACRIHTTRRKIPKNDKPLRFMEFLKSRIKGCRINSCRQIGYERVIKLDLTNSQEHFFMFVRLWSAAANIIVTDENLKVLDVFYRRPKKNEVSGGVFVPPEPLPKSEEDLSRFPVRTFDELDESGDAWDAASGTASRTKAEGSSSEGEGPVVARPAGSLSFCEKIDRWYGEHAERLSREALLEQAQKLYTSRRSRMEAALKKLEGKREAFLLAEQWKHQGDLVLSYGHLIKPELSYLECVDYDTGNTIRIPVDPEKSTQKNAEFYYDKYKKALSGLDDLEHDISRAKKDILALEYAYDALLKEPNPLRMQQMIRQQTKPKQQIAKKHPGIGYEVKGWTILAGRDADENDELLRHHVKGADMWLHARDWPGGYVFIKARPGKTVPLEILLDAGNLAVYYSKARKARTADLYYTQVKYLRRAKNAPKGTVLPSQEKNICITLDEERLRKLEDCKKE
ncbi:MAG: NFACT family protein [Treponemataceae bacterium]|nr:NFACT family protein [Treponemataceae bacterium]